MEKTFFGTSKDGKEVFKYTLKNEYLTLSVMNRGATILSLIFDGTDTVLGFDTLSDYETDFLNHGATIGRVADRIENAAFVMDGKKYELTKNSGNHCLHGGRGFNARVFDVKELRDEKITFSYTAEDGEEGFPSRLKTDVSYTLDGANLIIDYKAEPEGKTPIALTNHAYFNLNGGGKVFSHEVRLYSDRYAEMTKTLVPSGKHIDVSGTDFDFRRKRKIHEGEEEDFRGYDNFYFIKSDEKKRFGDKLLTLAAEVFGEKIQLKVYTNQPGVLFYTGNYLKGPPFRGGVPEENFMGLCLETGTEPNALNKGETFYDKGEVYSHTSVYSFSRKDG